MSDDRESRLPKWAQQELQRLRSNVAYYKAIAEAGEGPSDTRVDVGPMAWRNLQSGSRIEFFLDMNDGDERWRRQGIQVRVVDGRLYVQGNDSLDIRPQASNAVSIGIVER